MSDSSPVLTPSMLVLERFGFTLFIAVALHALLILGITFTADPPKPPTQTLEVTLASRPDLTAPEEADFIAQHNQQGSGESEEVHRTTTHQAVAGEQQSHTKPAGLSQQALDLQLDAQATPPAPQTAESKAAPTPLPAPAEKTVLSSVNSERKTPTTASAEEKPAVNKPTGGSLLSRSLDFAGAQAEIDLTSDPLSKRTRLKRLTSSSTRSREDALYLNNWRNRIERIGNLNYPAEARRKHQYGSLRLLVSILPDGSLKSVRILSSSGFPVLDDAAIKIVRLAAPFQPFPAEMMKTTDVLEIIRTWKFEKKAYLE